MLLRKIRAIRRKNRTRNTGACGEMVNLVKMKKKSGNRISVAEIGVDIGATSMEIVKLLDDNDNFYLFDFDEKLDDLREKLNLNSKAKLHFCGNSSKIYDSYNWSLANVWNSKKEEIFDIVYLDGAHTFFHDGLTCCLLKNMVKDGGIILFDDIDWSIWNSPTINPTVNPKISRQYTDEQMKCKQIKLVCEMFMDTDDKFHVLEEFTNERKAAYMKN